MGTTCENNSATGTFILSFFSSEGFLSAFKGYILIYMNKKIISISLASLCMFGVATVFGYINNDGAGSDANNAWLRKGAVISVQMTECTILQSSSLRYTVRDYSNSTDVRDLQNFLYKSSLLSIAPTGYFGVNTYKAVKLFQKNNGINPTGFVGTLTKVKIRELSCGVNDGSSTIPSTLVCTDDVKLCEDGSYVPRVAPYCSFKACPTNNDGGSKTPMVSSGAVALYQKVAINGITITPTGNVSDSRCPMNVQCITAGTVSVDVTIVGTDGATITDRLSLGDTKYLAKRSITLTDVTPSPAKTMNSISESQYLFTFSIMPGSATIDNGGVVSSEPKESSKQTLCTDTPRYCADGSLMPKNSNTCVWYPQNCPTVSSTETKI